MNVEEMKAKQEELLKATNRIKDKIEILIDKKVTDEGMLKLKFWIKQFGEESVSMAVEESVDRYYVGTHESAVNTFEKIGGICYNWSCLE